MPNSPEYNTPPPGASPTQAKPTPGGGKPTDTTGVHVAMQEALDAEGPQLSEEHRIEQAALMRAEANGEDGASCSAS